MRYSYYIKQSKINKLANVLLYFYVFDYSKINIINQNNSFFVYRVSFYSIFDNSSK